jgi:hypothetical protein
MSRAELGAFIESAEQERNLWGSRRGGVRATAMLRNYALLRASALSYREARDFQRAIHEESECARLLEELPRWARW